MPYLLFCSTGFPTETTKALPSVIGWVAVKEPKLSYPN